MFRSTHLAGRVQAHRGLEEGRVAGLDTVPDAALEVRVPRRDGVGPNVLFCQLERQTMNVADDRRLRGAVGT